MRDRPWPPRRAGLAGREPSSLCWRVLPDLLAGRVALRSSLRRGGWLVHGADGWFEARLEVDDVVELVPIGEPEALAAAERGGHGLVLLPPQREEVARKTCFARYAEVFADWRVSLRWGATSEHVGGATYEAPEAFEAARAQRLGYTVAFTRRPDRPARGDRGQILLEAVRAGDGFVLLTVGRESGAVVAAPAPFAGHPLGLATFEGDRLARLHLPFGALVAEALRKRLVEELLPVTPWSPPQREELARKCAVAGWREVLAREPITVQAGFGAPVRFSDPAEHDALAALVGGAFTATLTFGGSPPEPVGPR